MRVARPAVIVAACVLVAGVTSGPAAAAPQARLTDEHQLEPVYNQGIARGKGGWVLSGTLVLAHVDEKLQDIKRVNDPIPPDWAARGFNHVGDIDVAGRYVYAPYEQPDYERGEQAIARYDAKTLAFVDAVTVPQHEASFVTIDPKKMIAYSMDRFGGDALLRYDLRKGWKQLKPLRMSHFVDRVQGADVDGGAVWLSTDDDTERPLPSRSSERQGRSPRQRGARGRRRRGHRRNQAAKRPAPFPHHRRDVHPGVARQPRRFRMSQAQARKVGLRARARYRFDSLMSRGTGIVILWLGVITVGFVFVAALALTIFGVGVNEDANPSLLERFWQTLLRILDPGTFSGDTGWPLRITMLLVTLLGVLIGGSLIGLIVATVDSKVEQLRRGRSAVVEHGHTLILGWSPRVFTLISEIVDREQEPARRTRRHPGSGGEARRWRTRSATGSATRRPPRRVPHR